MSPGVVFVFPRKAVVCGHVIKLAATLEDDPIFGFADPHGGLDKGVQHGLKVKCRSTDDFEHIRSRSLLLEGFSQLIGTHPYLLEQPYVLNGNHRLIRKGLEQFELLVAERAHLRSSYSQSTNRLIILHQRRGSNRSMTGSQGCFSTDWKLLNGGLEIKDVLQFPVTERSAGNRIPRKRHWFEIQRDRTMMRLGSKLPVFRQKNDWVMRVAEACSTLGDHLQYRLDVSWRRGDHAQDLAGRSLLL